MPRRAEGESPLTAAERQARQRARREARAEALREALKQIARAATIREARSIAAAALAE